MITKPLLAKHLTAFIGLIFELRVNPKSGGFTLIKLSSGLMSLTMIGSELAASFNLVKSP
mgnify:CR=1 FL=1